MKQSPRVTRLLQKFAHITGGLDADGRSWPQDAAKQKQHLFHIRNRDMDTPHGTFVLGHVIQELIVDDYYDIEYLGLHRDFIHPYLSPNVQPKTKEQKEMYKRVIKLLERQEKDLAYGRRVADEQQGIFRLEEEEESEPASQEELVS